MPNNIHRIIASSSLSQPPISEISGQDGRSDRKCHGFVYDAFLLVPALLFVVYMAVNAKKNFDKLRNGRSYVMISYYALLWLASGLNLAWCSLQVYIWPLFFSSNKYVPLDLILCLMKVLCPLTFFFNCKFG